MAMFDQYTLDALNEIDGMLGPDASTPGVPAAPGMPATKMGPMGAFGPGAMMGALSPTPFQADPTLQRDANIMGMFSNLSQVGGGPALNNPFQQQIAQAQEQHNMLQKARMSMLQKQATDNPFYDYELAKQKGYFELKEGENDAQGFRRYTQEQFKDPSESVYGEKMGDLENLMGNRGDATKLANGLLEVRTGPNGEIGVYDLSTEEFRTDMTPAMITKGKEMIKGGEARGTNVANQVQADLMRLREIEESGFELDQSIEMMDGWLEALESGEMETGVISGTLKELGLTGNETDGEMMGDQVEQALTNLGIVNLAPVTDKEMQEIKKLFADLKSPTEVNIGKLKSALNRIYRKLDASDFKAKQSRDYILEHGDQRDKDYVNKFFPSKISLEEAAAQAGGI